MAERIFSDVPEEDDPSVVLTFNGKNGETVKVIVTVTVEGDVREVWDDLAHLSEREAFHQVSGDIFFDMTRMV